MEVGRAGREGVYLLDTWRLLIDGLEVGGALSDGVWALSYDGIFKGVHAHNGGMNGVYAFGQWNVFSNTIAGHNVQTGLNSTDWQSTFVRSTLVANARGHWQRSDFPTIVNSVAANNGPSGGFDVNAGADATLRGLAAVGNDAYGLSIGPFADNVQVVPPLLVYDNNDSGVATDECFVAAGRTNVHLPPLASDCASGTVTPVTDVALSTAFLGRVANDVANGNDALLVSGVLQEAQVTDLVGFSSPFRSWGVAAADPMDPVLRGGCTSGSGRSCAIWDWRLPASSPLRSTVGDGSNATSFVPGATCPAIVHGDVVVTDRREYELYDDASGNEDGTCEAGEGCVVRSTFLANAQELLHDDVGDEDTLCESGERCVVAPNFGAYQGTGDLHGRTCVFQDGVVSGVTMYGFPQN